MNEEPTTGQEQEAAPPSDQAGLLLVIGLDGTIRTQPMAPGQWPVQRTATFADVRAMAAEIWQESLAFKLVEVQNKVAVMHEQMKRGPNVVPVAGNGGFMNGLRSALGRKH